MLRPKGYISKSDLDNAEAAERTAAAGHASGEAMNEMEQIVTSELPRGFGFD